MGRVVIGTYVECLRRDCSGLPHIGARCPKCDSTNVEPFVMENLPPKTMRCVPFDHVFWDINAADSTASDDGA